MLFFIFIVYVDYYMFIIESLDVDIEFCRFFLVVLLFNGYIDLFNGLMDYGCCFGYVCMERILIFFFIVVI